MPDFIFNPPAGKPIGALAVAPTPAGSAPSPAQPGSITYSTPGDYHLVVTAGMLPMRIEGYGAGGGGGAVSAASKAAGGGGGGGYTAGTFGDALIVPGSNLLISVPERPDGVGGTGLTTGLTALVAIGATTMLYAAGGSGANGGFGFPRSGGGTQPGFPNFCVAGAVNVILANGQDGEVGTTVASGAGGDAAGPDGGLGGAGGTTHIGFDGADPGGGGGGAKFVGSDVGGRGGAGRLVLTWPAPE